MRRIMFIAVASLAIMAIAPASVLAKHHSKRHHSRAHHARVHHKRFGTLTTPSSGSTTTTTPTTPPATSPTAGTVDSFDGTTLVIRLADNTTLVSGTVTPNTEIECAAAGMGDTGEASDVMHADGDQGGGGDGSSGGGDGSSGGGDGSSGGGDEGGTTATCTSANLVKGAVVEGAELEISSAGATWDKVELAG